MKNCLRRTEYVVQNEMLQSLKRKKRNQSQKNQRNEKLNQKRNQKRKKRKHKFLYQHYQLNLMLPTTFFSYLEI